MPSLQNLRNEIDRLDSIIMEALEARFNLMPSIAKVKKAESLATTQASREEVVLKKAEVFSHEAAIQEVYLTIMAQSKLLQSG